MPKVELPFEILLEATEQLDSLQLEALLQRATAHQKRQQEEKLLAIWEQPPLSLESRARAEKLRQMLEDGQISELERRELLQMDDQATEAQVRRLQAVVDLAHLRGVEPSLLLEQLQSRTS